MIAWAEEDGIHRSRTSSPIKSRSGVPSSPRSYGRRSGTSSSAGGSGGGGTTRWNGNWSASSSPTKKRPPPLLTRDSLSSSSQVIGHSPKSLIDKTLLSLHRSSTHPTLFLNFSDKTSYQLMVAGYDPSFPGVRKKLEMDEYLLRIFPVGVRTEVEMKIVDCALVRLCDKAFERRGCVGSGERKRKVSFSPTTSGTGTNEGTDHKWDQNHMSLALKFEGVDGWHTIWAMMYELESDQTDLAMDVDKNQPVNPNRNTDITIPPVETFRSYEDVYIMDVTSRSLSSPRKKNRRNSKNSEWSWSSNAS